MKETEQKQRQKFFDAIIEYPYIRDDGRLELEPFCVYLSHCFGFDGILEISPQPRDVYLLLLDIIRETLGPTDANRYIRHQRISDWTPDMAYIFPEKTKTCIHPSALVHVSHIWIYGIGHDLMRIPEPAEGGKYFAWVKEDWLAVHTFINGYHNAFYAFQKRIDKAGIAEKGYSLFEALHLSRRKNIDFDEAEELLKARHASYQAALNRIEAAINDGYFLEAITLEECLVSNCLFNFLDNVGVRLTNPSFHTLLNKILTNDKAHQELPTELFTAIDEWRQARNTSIHGYVTSRSDGLDQSRADFNVMATSTARQGRDFCQSIVAWYELECVNFIRHQFPSKRSENIH